MPDILTELSPMDDISQIVRDFCDASPHTLENLRKILRFPIEFKRKGRGRTELALPQEVRFAYLSRDQPLREEPKYCVGLQRGPYDPDGLALDDWWTMDSFNYLAEKPKPGESRITYRGEITCSATLLASPKAIVVMQIQANQFDSSVEGQCELAEFALTSVGTTQPAEVASTVSRIALARQTSIPWAYPDRLLLFGPLAMYLASETGINAVHFMLKYYPAAGGVIRMSPTRRAYELAMHTDFPGVSVEKRFFSKSGLTQCLAGK